MLTGLTCLLVTLTLSVLMPRLNATRGHDDSGGTETFSYSIRWSRFFLAAFVAAGLALAVACVVGRPAGRAHGWLVPAIGLVGVGFVGLFYVHVSSYRVRVDAERIEVRNAFRSRSVELATIAAIGVARGRGVDLTLYGRDDRCLATIGGSVQDFESLLATLERRTRSPDVMLYRAQGFVIEEKPNDPHAAWRSSKGPRASRRKALTSLVLIVSIAALVVGVASHLTR